VVSVLAAGWIVRTDEDDARYDAKDYDDSMREGM